MQPTREERQALLATAADLVQTKFFDPKFNGVNWRELVLSRTERILSAEDFAKEMQDLLAELGSHPTGFFHQSARKLPPHRAINATFHEAQTSDGPRWMFQDVHLDGPAYNA